MGNESVSSFQYSYPVETEHPEGRTPIFRSKNEPLLDDTPYSTLSHAFDAVVEQYGDRDFLGTRSVNPDRTFGEYTWRTYSEVASIVRIFMPHLISLCPRDSEDLAYLGVYMKNCEEWIITDLSCQKANIILVPLYETLGQNSLQFIVNQSKMQTIICTSNYIEEIVQAKKNEEIPSLTNIILVGSELTEEIVTST